jgi:cyclic pyranopterin phosphate synthase
MKVSPMSEPSPRSTHFNAAGDVHMVDVSAKPTTIRTATATGYINMRAETAAMIRGGTAAKGDVLAVARLAAITATKLTPLLIPLCHAIAVEAVEVRFRITDDTTLWCEVDVRTSGKTGVEMEAMTAVAAACLTIYDMCKSVDRGMAIGNIRLLHKAGGASGVFRSED